MFDATTVPKLVTLLVSVLIFEAWERQRPSRPIDRRRHLGLNVLAFSIVVVAGAAWQRALAAGFEAIGLHDLLARLEPVRALPGPIKILLGVVLADFCLYWVHRWMHGPAFLWRAHKFHHSTEDLYWLSGARTSLFHLLLFAVPQILIARYVLDLSAVQTAVGFSLGVFVNLWVHSNVTAHLGPLEWLIVTPDVHRSHHGRDINPSKNLGFMFTIWDRIFGTYLDPRTLPADYPLGLNEETPNLPKMIAGL